MPKRGDPDVAIGYVRSSPRDEQTGLGPAAQRAAMESWCRANAVKLVCTHEDIDVSGATPIDKRPGLLCALDAIRAQGSGVLLVAKRDRVARDVIVGAMIEQLVERQGARVVSSDGVGNEDSPEGKLMRRMVSAFSEYERALIRSRTRSALAAKRARGEKCGGQQTPFGYRLAPDRRRLEIEPSEHEVVQRLHSLRAEGASFAKIAGILNREGVPARGTRWHATTIGRILKRDAAQFAAVRYRGTSNH